jgi:eukaryotic-like serine/threonine-protein kinase
VPPMPGPEAPAPGGPERKAPDASQAMSALLLELATMPRRSDDWARTLRPGERVGRFELLSEIGQGGFGIVYEARDLELGRLVAFKAVRPGRGLESGAGELLLREAEAIARLSHPNLVTLHDVGRCEQGPYLVLELLRGVTLGARIRQGPLEPREALRVGLEVARGLCHAHAEGVVHRDLKPNNVFLCDGGHVKVLDFGMAHAFGRERTLGGTPAYMAPEQWSDGAEDERTDVFALGVMLYQMLVGQVPLPEGGRSLEAGPAPELSVPACPALGKLVGSMLERDPGRRPRDAEEVVAALAGFLGALRAGDDSTVSFLTPWVPRRRFLRPVALAAVATGLLVAAAALTAGWWALRTPARAAPSVAVLPFTPLSGAPEDASLAGGLQAEIITALTQIGAVRVLGRDSVQGLGAEVSRDPRQVARRLGVSALVEGTVERDGPRIRIQAQLVDPESGAPRWAERFDRRADDLFAVESEVALQIARALGARLTPAERARIERAPTHDAAAHELYLQALYFWGRSSDDADRNRSQELLTAAVARDPGFALAHAWLAVLDTELANDGVAGFQREPTCAEARRQAERALALEPDLPQAHGALAEVRWACEADNPGALAEYEAQVRGLPGDAVARVNLGWTRVAMGQWAAAAEDLRAAAVLDPRSYFVAVLVADRMTLLRRFDEAEAACTRAHELSPGDVRAPALCAMIPFWRDGDTRPARATLDTVLHQWAVSNTAVASGVDLLNILPDAVLELERTGRLPDPISADSPFLPRSLLVGIAHQSLGHQGEARSSLSRAVAPLEAAVAALRSQPDREALEVELFWLARAHAGAGRGEEALREVREALALVPDASMRYQALVDAAEIATAAGQPAEAVAFVAEALGAPAGPLTPASARADPGLASLRGYPPFEALLSARLAGR